MFTIDSPANSIIELLSFLRNDSPHRYLFRGQTKDYDYLIPSMFRQGLSGKFFGEGWVGLNNEIYRSNSTDQLRVKAMVRRALMKILGKGLGNIVAQQYGLASETIDVTEDPTIAAFFATRTYPDYSHFRGNDNIPIGVIYRFEKWPDPSDCSHLEVQMSVMSLEDYNGASKIWFTNRVAIPRMELDGDEEGLRKLNEYFSQYGRREDALLTNHTRIHHSAIAKMWNSLSRADGSVVPKIAISRIAAQEGGFMYPIIQHHCIHPTKIKLSPTKWNNEFYADPSLIAIRNSLALHDIKRSPDIEIFYFKHSQIEVGTFSREDLWPTREQDELRAFVEDLAKTVGKDYLEDYETTVDNHTNGIVDPGFYEN